MSPPARRLYAVLYYSIGGHTEQVARQIAMAPGAPIWAGRPAMPLRSYLSQHPALPHTVGLFVTSGGPNAPERAYEMAQGLLGRPIAAKLHVPNRLDAQKGQDRVTRYCDAMRAASGALTSG